MLKMKKQKKIYCALLNCEKPEQYANVKSQREREREREREIVHIYLYEETATICIYLKTNRRNISYVSSLYLKQQNNDNNNNTFLAEKSESTEKNHRYIFNKNETVPHLKRSRSDQSSCVFGSIIRTRFSQPTKKRSRPRGQLNSSRQ